MKHGLRRVPKLEPPNQVTFSCVRTLGHSTREPTIFFSHQSHRVSLGTSYLRLFNALLITVP